MINRALLSKAFPDNPRLVAEFEDLDRLLGETETRIAAAKEQIEALGQLTVGFQPASALLDALSALPNRIGAIEISAEGQANIRPIDGQDPASLITRGVAYTVLVAIAGQGTTANRPAAPDNAMGIYYDTDLLKPILWAGPALGWRDFTGAAV